MFRNYLTIAYRNILRHKLFSFINILGLSLGISVCLLIILMIVDQFSYDAYNPNKDRIYRIITEQSWADNGKGKFAAAPAPLAQYLQAEYPGLDKVAFMRSLSYRALHNGKDMDLSGFYANPDFLDVFSRELEDGNPNNALNDPYSIVISEKVADMFFRNENPVGKVLSLEDYDGKKAGDFIVTGVLKERGNKSHLKYDLLVSMNTLTSLAKRNNDQTLSNWQQVSNYYVYALLKENQPVANLQHVLDELSRKELSRKEAYPHTRFELQHLLNINLTDEMLANEPGPILKAQILYLFGGLALIVIISACFNYNSLCVARSLNRAKEVGVRKVAGASRSHIIWQFLIESVLMALIALVFGLTFLQFIKPAFYNLDPFVKTLFNLDENLLVYALFVVFTIVVGITAGLFPALVLSRFQPVHVLKKLTNLSMFSKFRLQRILLVIQFSLSLICIIFTIVAYRQFAHTMEADLGFNTANVLNVSLQGQSYDLYKQSVAQHKNISTVSAASYLPGQGINMGVEVKKPGMEKSIWLDYVAVDPNYIPAMDIKLIAGRNFSGVDSLQQEKFIIINQTAVEKFNLGDAYSAIGQFLRIDEKNLQVIGVVKDFVIRRPGEAIQPGALRNLANELRYANIHLTGKQVSTTLQDLEKSWRNLDALHPFRYKFYDDSLAASHVGYTIMMKIVGFAGFLSVCIASFGLLGIAIYSTQSRVKELSIRKVLGADTASLALLLSKNFLQLVLFAIIIGTTAGYFISHTWLQNHAYRIDIGPGTLLAGVVIILVLTLLTVGVQVAKTVRTNPVDHLKME